MTGRQTKHPAPTRQALPRPKEWRDLLPLLTEQERDELDALLLAPVPWAPFPGPQTRALKSKADIVGYGGAAGGGKGLDLSTPLPCPSGFVRMGDVKVGDLLFDKDGET